MRWKNAWGRITHYTVSGTSQTYLVNLTLPNYGSTQPNIPRTEGDPPKMSHPLTMGNAQWSPDRHQPLAAFCTCPAFAYTIMLAPHGSRSTPLMVNTLTLQFCLALTILVCNKCKHILAARIAERMERVSEQTASDDADFEQLACYI